MARVIKQNTAQAPGWARQQIAAFVCWQQDLPPFHYWTAVACGVGFAGFGISFLLRGVRALQQGNDWSSLLATGNHRVPYVSVGREIVSGSLIVLLCVVLLSGMIASRCSWLDRFAAD